MVVAYIRTIFAQPDQATAKVQLRQDEILAYMAFPKEHHRQIHSTNPFERLNKEIKRRADVVGHIPQRRVRAEASGMGEVMMEQNDEGIVLRRYFNQESMSQLSPWTDATVALPPVDQAYAKTCVFLKLDTTCPLKRIPRSAAGRDFGAMTLNNLICAVCSTENRKHKLTQKH